MWTPYIKKSLETVTWINSSLNIPSVLCKTWCILKRDVNIHVTYHLKMGVLLHFQCLMLNSTKLNFIKFSNLNKRTSHLCPDTHKAFRINILYLMFSETMFDKNLFGLILFISSFGWLHFFIYFFICWYFIILLLRKIRFFFQN